jgi:decaprenylphospho-beta-D-ribofuranose 2-oxidase
VAKGNLSSAPQWVLSGFGRSVRSVGRRVVPTDRAELPALFQRASAESVPVALRGSGRSYGDAALNEGGVVLDLRSLNRVLGFDASTGIVEVEPGVTIEDLWRATLPHGFWPPVVPGTMAPTLAGCLAMNIHGKNNFRAGPLGEHVLDFDLLTPEGRTIRCSPTEQPALFEAAIGGFGALGIFTRIRLQLDPVASGLLRVEPIRAASLDEMFDRFEERLPRADYLVGWIDGLAGGRHLGRGQIHQANYLPEWEDPWGKESLAAARQDLPSTLFGVPRAFLPSLMRPFFNDPGLRLLNLGKYLSAAFLRAGETYLQSHVAFAFLLDYIPGWEGAYGRAGLIQYQPFVPRAAARQVFGELLRMCQRAGLPPYLVVFKRHRPDRFLMSHAVDGYSLAMDFKVRQREALWDLCHRMSDRVLDAGGKFYFAKDSVLRPNDAVRSYGLPAIEAFRDLKRRLDPQGLLQTDLTRRVFGAM